MAAPYAAVPGEGRVPLTLLIMMIDPPSAWPCMTAFAACATCSGASRFSSMILAWNRGDAVAAAARRRPAGVVDHDVQPAEAFDRLADQPLDLVRVAHVGAAEHGGARRPRHGTRRRLASGRTTSTLRAGVAGTRAAMPRPTPRAPPVTTRPGPRNRSARMGHMLGLLPSKR